MTVTRRAAVADKVAHEVDYWVRYAREHGAVVEVTESEYDPLRRLMYISEQGEWAWAGCKVWIVVSPARGDRIGTQTMITLDRGPYARKRKGARDQRLTRQSARNWIDIIGRAWGKGN